MDSFYIKGECTCEWAVIDLKEDPDIKKKYRSEKEYDWHKKQNGLENINCCRIPGQKERERERQTETLFFRVNIYLEPGSVHLKTAITHCAIELDILGNLKAFQ